MALWQPMLLGSHLFLWVQRRGITLLWKLYRRHGSSGKLENILEHTRDLGKTSNQKNACESLGVCKKSVEDEAGMRGRS